MNDILTLSSSVKSMVESIGMNDVYDFPPSAKACPCPIVVCNESYERSDLLDDCEYGNDSLDLIVVRETKDAAIKTISEMIFALHRLDWDRYSNDRLRIRGIAVCGLPRQLPNDSSGRIRMKANLSIDVCISHE